MTDRNWRSTTLGEIGATGLLRDGDWVESKDQDPDGSVRLTQLADVGIGDFRDRSDRWLREDQALRLGCTFLAPDDVLIARMPEPLGRACLVPETIGRAVTVVDVAVLRPNPMQFDSRFLAWALNSPAIHRAMVSMQTGTTRKRISRRNLSTISLDIPSLHEQRRIVAILEDHLSRLDAASGYLSTGKSRASSLLTSTFRQLMGSDPVRHDRLENVLATPLTNGRSVPTRDGGFPSCA